MPPFPLSGPFSRYRRRLSSSSSSSLPSSSPSSSSSSSSSLQHPIQLLEDEDEDEGGREGGVEGWMRRALVLQGDDEKERRTDFLYWHRVLMATIKEGEEGQGGRE